MLPTPMALIIPGGKHHEILTICIIFYEGDIQIQIQNIFIEHNTWVYIENQEYETQMGLFNSTITKHHIVVFYLSFALEKTNWVSRWR